MELEFFCKGQLGACWYQTFLVQCPIELTALLEVGRQILVYTVLSGNCFYLIDR